MREYFEIIRPWNCLIAFIACLFGFYVVTGQMVFSDYKLAIASLALFFGVAGGNVINDYFDLGIDKINKPNRVLPRGAMKPNTALYYSMLLFLVSIALSFFINTRTFLLVLFGCSLMTLYGKYSKRMKMVGNVIVSFLVSLVFIFISFVTGIFFPILWIVPPAFLLTESREIAKDIEDVAGDRKFSKNSIPMIVGVKTSSLLSVFLVFVAFVAAAVPFLYGTFGQNYMIVLSLSLPLLGYVIVKFLRKPEDNARLYQLSLKITMVIALVAILVG